MKRILKAGTSLLALAGVTVAAQAGNAGVTALQKTATGITLQTSQGTLVIEPWADRIVHVAAYRNADLPDSDEIIGSAGFAWRLT